MANTNKYPGLASGPIDHKASSVINCISYTSIDMGDAVHLAASIPVTELLPRVGQKASAQGSLAYGVAVAGVVDGVYGNGTVSSGDVNKATNAAGQGVTVCTRGRCLARVRGSKSGTDAALVIGAPLTQSVVAGVLEEAALADAVVAILLQPIASGDVDIVAIDLGQQGVDTNT